MKNPYAMSLSSELLFDIESSIPDNIRTNYPIFVDFIMHYYKTLYESDAYAMLSKYRQFITSMEDSQAALDLVMGDLGFNFKLNKNISADVALVLLNELKRTRGSENSVKLFFRLAHDTDVVVDTPKNSLSKLSDAPAVIVHSTLLKVVDFVTEEPRRFTSYESRLNCSIDDTVPFFKDGELYVYVTYTGDDHALKLNERVDLLSESDRASPSVVVGFDEPVIENGGKFYAVGDRFVATDALLAGEYEVTDVNYGSVFTVDVEVPGEGYAVNDRVFTKPNGGFSGRVREVDSNGGIVSVHVDHVGSNFKDEPDLFVKSGNGHGALLKCGNHNIGTIKKFKTLMPSMGVNNPSDVACVRHFTEKGQDAVIQFEKTPFVTKRDTLDSRHLLEVSCHLVDSRHLHDYSYNLITDAKYDTFADDYERYLARMGYNYVHVRPIWCEFNTTSDSITAVKCDEADIN